MILNVWMKPALCHPATDSAHGVSSHLNVLRRQRPDPLHVALPRAVPNPVQQDHPVDSRSAPTRPVAAGGAAGLRSAWAAYANQDGILLWPGVAACSRGNSREVSERFVLCLLRVSTAAVCATWAPAGSPAYGYCTDSRRRPLASVWRHLNRLAL